MQNSPSAAASAAASRARAPRLSRQRFITPSIVLGACMGLTIGFTPPASAELKVFRNAEIHPVVTAPIANGALVIEDGRILAVGPSVEIPTPDGAEEFDLSRRIVIPGMVDTHSHIGGPAGGDSSAPLNPEARSLDAIDVLSPSFWRARAGGITTLNVMPGSGHLMSGQTTYLKIRRNPRRIEDWLFCANPTTGICGSMKMANGTNSIREKPFPGTRSKSAALQRGLFVEAQNYLAKQRRAEADEDAEPPARDLRMEAMAEILAGERLVQFHTHRHNDILTVLRLAEEFNFTPVIQHGSDSWKVAAEIAAAGIPVSVTYVEAPGGKEETLDVNMQVGALLEAAGVDLSFNTDDYVLDSRLFLRYAALNVRYGMSETGALEALTLAGARHLGLEARVGSLEPGKDGDFVVLSGPPFSTYTRVLETWVEGERVFDFSDPEHRRYAVGDENTYRSQGVHHALGGGQ